MECIRLSRNDAKVFVCCVILLAVAVWVPAQTVPDQASGEQKRAAARQVAKEGSTLQKQRTAESLRKAIEKYQEALRLWREVGDRKQVAVTLNDIGVVYYDLGEYQQAINYYNEALPIYLEVGALKDRAITQRNLALIYRYSGQLQKALEALTSFLDFARQNNDPSGQAFGLSDIGNVYFKLGDYKKAKDYYQQALEIEKTLKNRDRQADVLSLLGDVQKVSGEPALAFASYNSALEIYREEKSGAGEAGIFSRLGDLHNRLGEYQKGLDYYWRALRYYDSIGDRKNKAPALHNLAMTYLNLGDERRALKTFGDALTLARQLGDREGEAYINSQIARLCFMLDGFTQALEYYNKALPAFQKFGNKQMQAETLLGIGRTYNALGNKEKALEFLREALPVFRDASNRALEAATQADIGRVLLSQKNYAEAAPSFELGLGIARAASQKMIEADALSNLASLERDKGNLLRARPLIESATEIIESIRGQITSADLRATYFAYFKNYNDLYIDILMRLHEQQPGSGLDVLALLAGERGRARSLMEFLIQAQTDTTLGVDPSLLERERKLQQQLGLKAAAQRRVAITADEKDALVREIEQLRIDLQQLQAEITRNRQRSPSLVNAPAPSANEIQQLIEPDTIILEYSLGEERSYGWAITSKEIKSVVLPKRSEIQAAARRVLETMHAQSPTMRNGETSEQRGARIISAGGKYPEEAANLSRMVLGPVANLLERKRLVTVADGILQYVPFAGLPLAAGQSLTANRPPLITKHEVVMLPSMAVLSMLRRGEGLRQRPTKNVAVFADPVFELTDERIKKGSPDHVSADRSPGTERLHEAFTRGGVALSRLDGTRREAEAIMKLDSSGASRQWLDFAASREAALNTDLSEYRLLHFATHGLIDTDRPELSALALSMIDEHGAELDGYLRAQDLFNLKLKADLVVLSACETALGRNLRGEGIIGLTQGFMRAGVPRVVVRLWSVDDAATAELMTRFYRKLSIKNQTPSAALREA